jgi:hypothetical protein
MDLNTTNYNEKDRDRDLFISIYVMTRQTILQVNKKIKSHLSARAYQES